MNRDACAKSLVRSLKAPNKNALRELTLYGSSNTKISPMTAVTKSRTPRLCASTGPTKKILTKRGSIKKLT